MSGKSNFKSKFNLNGLFNKKALFFISLLFMATIVFSPHNSEVNGWLDITKSCTVETEAELVDAISTALDNERSTIHISKDIVLTKSLEIPYGKDIFLIGYDRDVCLIGANGADTIVVRSGGSLVLYGRITVTHAEGDTGRGMYIERGGTVYLDGVIVSGNSADKGGGVYNEGTLSMGGTEDIEGSYIVNNIATLSGGGVYNKGTLDYKGQYWNSWIHGNTALSGEGDNLFIEEPKGNGQLYLLAIVIAVVIVGVVTGLLFWNSKKRKPVIALSDCKK